jgi:nucleoside-diphosphate-sugar epimerase
MQTILGSSGVIGRELAKNLQSIDKLRLVSRNPLKVNPSDELFSANLLDPNKVKQAVEGSGVVYLTVGLPYNKKTWKEQWPKIMHNVIEACKLHGSKLVFFDNIYLYGKVDGWIKEDTPIRPVSEKGKVRARLHNMIMNEVEKGALTALIARAGDFYGPASPLSIVNVLVFDNYNKGKKAQFLVTDKTRHSYTYTPDAGKATAMLGNTPGAFNQVWHLPTDKNVPTAKEFIEKVAAAFGVPPRYMLVKKWMLQMMGMFNKNLAEMVEMLYQNKHDQLLDSSKFEKQFNFSPTPYDTGIAETVRFMKSVK